MNSEDNKMQVNELSYAHIIICRTEIVTIIFALQSPFIQVKQAGVLHLIIFLKDL